MEQKIYFAEAYASENLYCLSLSDTAELIEEADENFNTDNDGNLLVEVEYPEFTVDAISEFLDENNREYTVEEKNRAIELIAQYEEDNTIDMDVVINLLDRVLDKQASKQLYAEAAKLGIGIIDIRKSGYTLESKRQERGLTQGQLSEMTGISRQNISSYESGKRNLASARVDNLMKLAYALDCKIDDLI